MEVYESISIVIMGLTIIMLSGEMVLVAMVVMVCWVIANVIFLRSLTAVTVAVITI